MTNAQIAKILQQVGDLLEFKGANSFRVRAYQNGARAIRESPESIATIVANEPERLVKIEGIGKSVAEKCVTLVDTGFLPQLNELLEEIPRTVLDMLRVPGLGPKRAAVLFRELGCKSLSDLRQACEQGRVRELSGFGAKTEKTILEGLEIAENVEERTLWADADHVVEEMREHLQVCKSIEQLEAAGSYRRGCETVGDLDFLVVSDDVDEVMDRFGEFPSVSAVLVRGNTKMSIRVAPGLQIDLRVVPAESFGAALQYFTGSKAHNVELRGRARQAGLKINEYGVFPVDDDQEKSIAGATESEVYATLELPCFPPEIREKRFEFEWAEQGELPALIELENIQGDLHMHTTASDGRNSLEEMAQAAIERGLKYIAITDHSQRVGMANGLDAERLRAQWKEIDELNDSLDGRLTVLKGVECDILEDGPMDLSDDVLAEADWVIASIHYGQMQSREQLTDRIVGALKNPFVSAIAHPTGRIINRREAYDVDLDAVFQVAREQGKYLELNAAPKRLDLNELHCAKASSLGIPITINTDAHSVRALNCMRYGIKQARRAGLTAADVVNTRPLEELELSREA